MDEKESRSISFIEWFLHVEDRPLPAWLPLILWRLRGLLFFLLQLALLFLVGYSLAPRDAQLASRPVLFFIFANPFFALAILAVYLQGMLWHYVIWRIRQADGTKYIWSIRAQSKILAHYEQLFGRDRWVRLNPNMVGGIGLVSALIGAVMFVVELAVTGLL